MQFIVNKKKNSYKHPARSCFFLSQIVTINETIPIMSRFLINKLDFLRV